MNSTDPLPTAPRDHKLFSGPRPGGLLGLMDLDQGIGPGFWVDGMASPIPGGQGSGHSGAACQDCEYITGIHWGLAWAVPLTKRPL